MSSTPARKGAASNTILEELLQHYLDAEESAKDAARRTTIFDDDGYEVYDSALTYEYDADERTEVVAKPPVPSTVSSRTKSKSAASTTSSTLLSVLGSLEPDTLHDSKKEPAVSTKTTIKKLSPVKRPNGQEYYPRHLAESSDVEALQLLRTEGVSVLLSGYPGCGKTSLVEAAFVDEGGPITFAGHGEAEIGDLVGVYVQKPDGSFEWIDGPLVKAMKEGRVLFVDDATLTPSGVLARLYPAMDGRGVITLTEHEGEAIVAQKGFYVVAAHNPGVPGAVLSEALASRFSIHLEVPSDLQLARSLGVEAAIVTVATKMQAKRAAGAVLWAPEMRELLAFMKVSKILGRTAALENLISICPESDREEFMPLLTRLLTDLRPLSLKHN